MSLFMTIEVAWSDDNSDDFSAGWPSSLPNRALTLISSSRVARFFSVKYTNTGKNIPQKHKIYVRNGHKIYQIAVKYTKWPLNIPTSSIASHCKNYPC
jgi:hypothetical protein